MVKQVIKCYLLLESSFIFSKPGGKLVPVLHEFYSFQGTLTRIMVYLQVVTRDKVQKGCFWTLELSHTQAQGTQQTDTAHKSPADILFSPEGQECVF